MLFPLHSFGVLRAGLLRGDTKERTQLIDAEHGVAITPQTNALEQTIDFVERTRRAFKVHKPADSDLIEHWYRSRASWLERNPLLAIRMTTQRGSYFDTESVVLSRVRAATARLAMVSTFQAGHPDRASRLFNTSRTNNWETLDIHHYIVLYDNPAQGGTLSGDCVPVQFRRSQIVELSIEIDPSFKGRRVSIARIVDAITLVYQGHLAHMWRRRRNTAPALPPGSSGGCISCDTAFRGEQPTRMRSPSCTPHAETSCTLALSRRASTFTLPNRRSCASSALLPRASARFRREPPRPCWPSRVTHPSREPAEQFSGTPRVARDRRGGSGSGRRRRGGCSIAAGHRRREAAGFAVRGVRSTSPAGRSKRAPGWTHQFDRAS